MKWIEAIEKAFTELGGKATEKEILNVLKTAEYKPYKSEAKSPDRSLNMYLNQKLKDRINKIGDYWILKSVDLQSNFASHSLGLKMADFLFPEVIEDDNNIYYEGSKKKLL
jgi:hypothetical protein